MLRKLTIYIQKSKKLKKKFNILLLFHPQLHYYSCIFYNKQCPPEPCSIMHTLFALNIQFSSPRFRMTQNGQVCNGSQPLSLTHLWLVSVAETLRFCLSSAGQMMFRIHVRTWICVPHCCCTCHSRHGKLRDRQAGRKEAPFIPSSTDHSDASKGEIILLN